VNFIMQIPKCIQRRRDNEGNHYLDGELVIDAANRCGNQCPERIALLTDEVCTTSGREICSGMQECEADRRIHNPLQLVKGKLFARRPLPRTGRTF
jgi:hypothetical protein